MLPKTITNNTFHDIRINEGEILLLPGLPRLAHSTFKHPVGQCKLASQPGNTPHNPIRYVNTAGLVMERKRPAEALDRLRYHE